MQNDRPKSKKIAIDYFIKGMDFLAAGEASSKIKHTLQLIGFRPEIIRRAAIAAYESEMNMVIHSTRGMLKTVITPDRIELIAEDEGPGIPDIELAMMEGYSTAPDHVREMGFGAGMGLPNIKKCADEFTLESQVGRGTTLKVIINNRKE